MKDKPKAKNQKPKLQVKNKKVWDLGFGIWDLQSKAGFSLIELIISVTLFIIAISIALFAVLGTNGLIQKADARSAISESTRGVGDAIRQALDSAPVGAVSLLSDQGSYVAVQVKAFSSLQSGNICTVIGRAVVSPDPNATGEEKYTINKDGTLIAVLIYNIDSGGFCPTTAPIYQNRLTNSQAVVKDIQFSLQNIACTMSPPTCVSKQLLRYLVTLAMAQKGSGGTSEGRQPTLTIQEGLPIGLVNEAILVLKIETTSLPNGSVSSVYNASVAASGGIPAYIWTLVDAINYPLPAGLTLHSDTGVIDGTPNPPTAGHSYPITIKVTDNATPSPNSTTRGFSITIDDQIIITTASALPDATVGPNYNVQLDANKGTNPCGGSCSWTLTSGNLPSGLALDIIGKISGQPNSGAELQSPYTLVIRATDRNNIGNFYEQTFTLTVTSGGGGSSI